MSISYAWLPRKNYTVAIGLIVAMIIWVGSGYLLREEQNESKVDATEPPLTSVMAIRSHAMPVDQQLKVSGRSEASRVSMLRAEVSGTLAAIPVAEGSFVNEGDVVCLLDAEDKHQRQKEALAQQDKAQLDYDGALRLKSSGYQSRTAIAQAKVALESAKAVVHKRTLELDQLAIRAPFSGVVNQRSAELGTLLSRGDSCATLLELTPLVVTGQVSEADVAHIKLGSTATVHWLSDDKSSGTVQFIGREADPVTRSFRVDIKIDNAEGVWRSGLTANMVLPAGHTIAHRISSAWLLLDDRGMLGLRVLDESNRVRFQRVDIIKGSTDDVWVSGLADKTTIITVGHYYVSEGEQVTPTIEGTIVDASDKSAPVDESESSETLRAAM